VSLLAPIEIGFVQGLIMSGAVLAFALSYRLLAFPDLTIEGSLPLGAAFYAVLVHAGSPLWIAAVCGCAAGSAAGAVTAIFNVRFGVNKFLAGIIMISIAYTLTLRVMSGSNVNLLQLPSFLAPLRGMFDDPTLGPLVALLTATLLSAVAAALFLGSRPGVALRAAGANSVFADAVGIPRKTAIVIGLAACNAFAACSGILQADYQGFSDVSSGQGVLIVALAALAIGEAITPKRQFRFHVFVVAAAVAGSIAYHIVVACAVRAGLAPTDLRLATGILVLIVVAARRTKAPELEELSVR
jgi:putative ABC transport system permease protein